jgi:hypothetical protein
VKTWCKSVRWKNSMKTPPILVGKLQHRQINHGKYGEIKKNEKNGEKMMNFIIMV